jgi:hypothetical protein
MTTDATPYLSALWIRFVPHFGSIASSSDRLQADPRRGHVLKLGACEPC